jgi:phytoene dehydrogenase-like protein
LEDEMKDESIIIIGAGFAGLSAGIYAQMNGYKTEVFELHNLPGGLCTSWKRKGFTIDGCIHWLVGSSPESGMHRYWEEVGIAQGREFIYADEYMRFEAADGRTFVMYTDLDRLERSMLEFAPQDAKVIGEFIRNVRTCSAFDAPPDAGPLLKRLSAGVRMGLLFLTKGRQMREWMKTTGAEFADKFTDPVLRGVIRNMWFPQFSVFFIFATLAWLHRKTAGYPIGGSLPMSQALEKRYLGLGGQIHYRSRVEKILTEADTAIGVRLEDGSEHRAGRVISAADGYSTIFKMLDGKYADEKTREPYEQWPIFPPLIYVGLGVNRSFADEPKSVSGMSFALRQPTEIADAVRERLSVHIFNQDPTLAPAGKTAITVMMPSSYEYWKERAKDREYYDETKSQVAKTVVGLLDERFPGIAGQVEMVDVATPLTFERYTGNWKGSFEGWLITPENSSTMMHPMSQTLPGLSNLFMCGQWVQPGGGLPTGVMSARRLLKTICKEDRKRFRTTVAG